MPTVLPRPARGNRTALPRRYVGRDRIGAVALAENVLRIISAEREIARRKSRTGAGRNGKRNCDVDKNPFDDCEHECPRGFHQSTAARSCAPAAASGRNVANVARPANRYVMTGSFGGAPNAPAANCGRLGGLSCRPAPSSSPGGRNSLFVSGKASSHIDHIKTLRGRRTMRFDKTEMRVHRQVFDHQHVGVKPQRTQAKAVDLTAAYSIRRRPKPSP